MDDFCIIVQGPGNFIKETKESIMDCGVRVIFSTWIGEEEYFSPNDEVIYTDKPSYTGPGNINLQRVSTLSGLYKAKEIGYKKALKIRSDMLITKPKSFIELFNNDKLNLFSWHFCDNGQYSGYVVDYLMSGSIDLLIKILEEQVDDYHIAEIILTKSILNNVNGIEFNYFMKSLNNSNDVLWLKYDIHLSLYNTINNGSYFGEMDLNAEDLKTIYLR